MKKSFLAKAALVLLTLTATTIVHAQVSPEEYQREQGRIEAAAYNHIIDMKKELDVIVKKISDLQEDVGYSTEDSHGLVKALGEKLFLTEESQTEFAEVAVEIQKQSGDELFKSYDKASKILNDARNNLAEAKKLVKQAH